MAEPQISNRLPLALERVAGKAPGTVIFRFDGPFTARTIFANQSPDAVDKTLDLHALLPSGEPPTVTIFDLSQVPYMDSAGLGFVVRYFARCQGKGVRFIAAGATPRVLELFRLTKVDAVLPLAASVDEADAQ